MWQIFHDCSSFFLFKSLFFKLCSDLDAGADNDDDGAAGGGGGGGGGDGIIWWHYITLDIYEIHDILVMLVHSFFIFNK